MTRTSIWDLRDMQRGSMSPRKAGTQPPPIGSPRLARPNPNRRLSAIGRLALRERPHLGYGHLSNLVPPRIAESNSGRLWPGRFSEAVNASGADGARRKVVDGTPNSARGLGRSSSAPRASRTPAIPGMPGGRPPAVPGSLSAAATAVATATRATVATSAHCELPGSGSAQSLSARLHSPGRSTALEVDLGVDAESWQVNERRSQSQASFLETTDHRSTDSAVQSVAGSSMFRAESADAATYKQYVMENGVIGAPWSRRPPPPLDSEEDGFDDPRTFQDDVDYEGLAQEELVLYTEVANDPSKPPGLGCIQPNGRAQVLQQWVGGTQIRSCVGQDSSSSQPPGVRGPASRPFDAIRSSMRPSQSTSSNSGPQEDGFEVEWSTLSEAARLALKQWSTGHLGGRHCMLIVEHSTSTDSSFGTDEPSVSSLRGGAALNVLSGLQAEVELIGHSDGSWLFLTVFAKQPSKVLEEAIAAALEEINDPRIENPSSLSAEQANLALRRRAMKVQCFSPQGKPLAEGGPRPMDEYMQTQVWLELLRQCFEASREGSQAPVLKSQEKQPKGEKALPSWNDAGVLRDLGKHETDLEAESDKMSLEALRFQNRHIEEYVMRLVRQRDELKIMMKLAEERDSYFILGLEGPESTEDEVKKAYRALARKEHPDKAGIGNKRRFQAIQQAYTSILRQIREGGSVGASRSPGAKDASRDRLGTASATVEEALAHTRRAKEAADRVAVCAHRTTKTSEDCGEVQKEPKRRALRVLKDLTKQSIMELRGAAEHLRVLGESVSGIATCAEAVMSEQKDAAEKTVAGVGIRDRAIIVDDAGRSSLTSAELLEKICEATEATLRKVEKADTAPGAQEVASGISRTRRDEAANLLHLGVRLLTESLTRTAAVARRSADEAIGAATKSHELSRGLAAVDLEARKERERAAAKQRTFDDDTDAVIVADDPASGAASSDAGDAEHAKTGGDENGAGKKTPRSKTDHPAGQASPRDQLKSAEKRVRERHVALRVKNLRFLSTLNEESLRLQARLRSLLERSEGALLPEISIVQKRQVFELVAQLLDFAVAEFARLVASPSGASAGPKKNLERVLSFATALDHAKDVAMSVESRTQALKLAALIDSDLLCQIICGPFRARLVAVGSRRIRSEGYPGRLRTRSNSLGVDLSGKALDEAVSASCTRIVASVQALNSASFSNCEEETSGSAP